MGRSLRVQYVGAMYHVINRGNARGEIFRDEKDYDYFKRWIGKVCEKSGWKVHAWTLMPNHYHLMIETRRKTLIQGMQLLNAEYTRYFNRRWKLCGPLFQGRYKATLVEGKAGYLLTVADYIHLNFARSFISKTMEELVANPETSVGCYVRGKFPEWMEWKKVMGSIGQENLESKARKRFYEHLKRKWGSMREEDPVWKELRRSWCFGGEKLKEKFQKAMEKNRGGSPATEIWQRGVASETEEFAARRELDQRLKKMKKTIKGLTVQEKYRLGLEIREKTCVSTKWLSLTLGMKSDNALRRGMSVTKKELNNK